MTRHVPLPSDVEEAVREFTDPEHCLGDTRCLHPRAQNILVGGHIARGGHSVNRIEIARKDGENT
jgi:hypothetical protein